MQIRYASNAMVVWRLYNGYVTHYILYQHDMLYEPATITRSSLDGTDKRSYSSNAIYLFSSGF